MEYGNLLYSIQLLDKTHLIASSDELRPAMTGLFIHNRFCFATDSYKANSGRVEYLNIDFGHDLDFKCILPLEIVREYWKTYKKSSLPRIDIYESKNDYNQNKLLAVCNNLALWCIDESFPPLTDTIYYFGLRNFLDEKDKGKIFNIRLNAGSLFKLAESLGTKEEVNLTVNPDRRQAFVHTESKDSGKINIGLLMLCREDNFSELDYKFWIKEFWNLQTSERQEEMVLYLKEQEEKEALKAIEEAQDTAEAEQNKLMLQYIQKNYPQIIDEAEADYINSMEELEEEEA
jgi:hypothetical protein